VQLGAVNYALMACSCCDMAAITTKMYEYIKERPNLKLIPNFFIHHSQNKIQVVPKPLRRRHSFSNIHDVVASNKNFP
jgi:hypothetical protein